MTDQEIISELREAVVDLGTARDQLEDKTNPTVSLRGKRLVSRVQSDLAALVDKIRDGD